MGHPPLGKSGQSHLRHWCSHVTCILSHFPSEVCHGAELCLEGPLRSSLREVAHYHVESWQREQENIDPSVYSTHKNIHFLLCFRRRNFKANVCSVQLNSQQNVR